MKIPETKRKITIETEYINIGEVKACWTEQEANELLATGKWVLLHGCVAHQDGLGYQAKPCWLMGKKA